MFCIAKMALISGFVALQANPKDEFHLMHAESIGGIKVGEGKEEAIKIFQSKPTMGKIEEWGSDLCFHQKVISLLDGLEISIVSETRMGKQTVESIKIKSPSRLKTKLGIGIGSSYSEVVKAYRSHMDKEYTKPGKVLVAGSVYGGLSFLFASGKVSQIFLGASAE